MNLKIILIKNVYRVAQTGIGKAMVIKLETVTDYQKKILADPQTSGGLLIAVDPKSVSEVGNLFNQNGLINS